MNLKSFSTLPISIRYFHVHSVAAFEFDVSGQQRRLDMNLAFNLIYCGAIETLLEGSTFRHIDPRVGYESEFFWREESEVSR